MTPVTYYPGCSLESTASDYDASIRAVSESMGIELKEIDDWNCCGSTAGHSLDHDASIKLCARNIVRAEPMGSDVVVPCALCFNQMKSAESALRQGEVEGFEFKGDITVLDYLEYMASPEVMEQFAGLCEKKLSGLKVASYYGCQANRPPKLTGKLHHENPMEMDRIVGACGAEAIDWPYKTDCCGASHVVARPEIVYELVGKLYDMAISSGAECFAVSCQMCQANLDMYQDEIGRQRGREYNLPVFYFTELMGLAMGHKDAPGWLGRHFVDPRPLLKKLELL